MMSGTCFKIMQAKKREGKIKRGKGGPAKKRMKPGSQ